MEAWADHGGSEKQADARLLRPTQTQTSQPGQPSAQREIAMTDSQPDQLSTDLRALRFEEGCIEQLDDGRVRVECGGDSWECSFWSLISELRYARSARSNDRAVYAAMAMQAVRKVNPACSSQEIAQSAVADADALLKELAK
jgi:hypothetical protein